jgi:hypothetical protein
MNHKIIYIIKIIIRIYTYYNMSIINIVIVDVDK